MAGGSPYRDSLVDDVASGWFEIGGHAFKLSAVVGLTHSSYDTYAYIYLIGGIKLDVHASDKKLNELRRRLHLRQLPDSNSVDV